jgi:hypothetical protein
VGTSISSRSSANLALFKGLSLDLASLKFDTDVDVAVLVLEVTMIPKFRIKAVEVAEGKDSRWTRV